MRANHYRHCERSEAIWNYVNQIATSEQYWFPSSSQWRSVIRLPRSLITYLSGSSQWRSVIRLPRRNSIDSRPPRNDAVLLDCHVGTVLIPVLLAMTQYYQIATSEQYWFPSSSQWRSVIRLPCRNSIDSSPPRNDAVLSDYHVAYNESLRLLAMTTLVRSPHRNSVDSWPLRHDKILLIYFLIVFRIPSTWV